MILIDTPPRPAATKWAAALLIMNGGLFLIPVTALLVFGVMHQLAPDMLATPLVLAALGASLLFAARAVWRGAHWPRRYVLVVVAGELVSIASGSTYIGAALLFVTLAALLLWGPSARQFAVTAGETAVSSRWSSSK
ncbi:hypothetical protein [Agromyces lapidis]|uniref:Uncharacterized protein n=1 Tax=Agromyces lapidis TaxID=279574 RepID=A0ABV5SQ94_9MICO|nr:hypothetical protein [Agromyces lapidis]